MIIMRSKYLGKRGVFSQQSFSLHSGSHFISQTAFFLLLLLLLCSIVEINLSSQSHKSNNEWKRKKKKKKILWLNSGVVYSMTMENVLYGAAKILSKMN